MSFWKDLSKMSFTAFLISNKSLSKPKKIKVERLRELTLKSRNLELHFVAYKAFLVSNKNLSKTKIILKVAWFDI